MTFFRLPRLIRLGKEEERVKFIMDISESISWFVKEYYWNGGQGSRRLTMDIEKP